MTKLHSMPSAKNSNKIIAPPLNIAGIDIDVESVKDAMLYINNNTGHDMVDRQIDEFILSTENSGYVESKQLEFSGRSYVGWAHSLMTICERYYEVDLTMDVAQPRPIQFIWMKR